MYDDTDGIAAFLQHLQFKCLRTNIELDHSTTKGVVMSNTKSLIFVTVGFLVISIIVGCPDSRSNNKLAKTTPITLSGRAKGTKDAASAISGQILKLKEYPPLPYPPSHQEYVKLLLEQCKVEYEVPQKPSGVIETEFIEEVRGWNNAVEVEIKHRFGVDIFELLHEEALKRWQGKPNRNAKE